MKAIQTPRCAAMKSGEDQALCVLDLGFLGLNGPEALNQLLAMQPGVPILVGGERAIEAMSGAGSAGGVRHLVRRSHSLEAFRLAVSRLRRTGAAMYLKLEF
jgi:predicted lysophospholipase L1 biosynthesis ABC-type transport system permease subunit